jgi:hypothetical protein
MSSTLTVRPHPSYHALLQREDCKNWANYFCRFVFADLNFPCPIPSEGITAILDDEWPRFVPTFGSDTFIYAWVSDEIYQTEVWEYWFREHNGWMIFGLNDTSLACLGGLHGALGEPPTSLDKMVVTLVANGDLSPLNSLKAVNCLQLKKIEPATDLGPISALVDLELLILEDTGDLISLEPLSTLSRLNYLELGRPRSVTNIAPLTNLSFLTKLKMERLSKVTDWTPLSSLRSLKELKLRNCAQEDLSPLLSLTELEALDLGMNIGIANLDPLAGMIHLKKLDLFGASKVLSLRPLSGLLQLEELELGMCSSIEDLTPLAGMTRLQSLRLWECSRVSDLRPLANLKELSSLSLMDCWRIPMEHREAVEQRDFDKLRSLLS